MAGLRGSFRRPMERGTGTEPKMIGLFGLFGTGNTGNDGSLLAMVRFLRRVAPQERPFCVCGDPSTVRQVLGLDAAPICAKPRLPFVGRTGALLERAAGSAAMGWHAVRCLRRLRVLIVPGTGFLDDFTASPLGWPLDVLTWCLLARLMGVRVIFVSIGAGPIRHPLSRMLMRWAARMAYYRSYRDDVSRTFMDRIGLDTGGDQVYPDLAFGLPAAARVQSRNGGRPLTIGVGVMAYGGWSKHGAHSGRIYATYLEKMTSFVTWLLDQGHAVRLLSGDDMDRWAIDDLSQAVGEARPGRPPGSIAFEHAGTLHELMQQIADTDIVVATRYHNIVCALRMCRPTISIGYAQKNDALLAQVGLSGWCQHIERLDVELLKVQLARMLAERSTVEGRIRQRIREFERRLQDQESILSRLIRHDNSAVHDVCAVVGR